MKTLAMLTGVLIGITSWGIQTSQVMLHGNVLASDSETLISGTRPSNFPLSDARITITTDEQVVHEQWSSSSGNYAAFLEAGIIYSVTVSKAGYLTRSFIIDTSDLPMSGASRVFKLYGDVTMLSTPPRLGDDEFSDRPMAQAYFHANLQRLDWDRAFAREAFEAILPELTGSFELVTNKD